MVTHPLVQIRHEIGFAYIAGTKHPELSSHEHPSAAVVLENGAPLPGPANAPHDDIRQLGAGRYSFWHSAVYFSTPDHSDPCMNGRSYAIAYTPFNLDRVATLISSRWRQVVVRSLGRASTFIRHVQLAQMFWGALYWLCFGYVLLRGRSTVRRRGE